MHGISWFTEIAKPWNLRCRTWFWWVREYIEFLISDRDKAEKVDKPSQTRKLELTEWWISTELAELLIRWNDYYDVHASYVWRR